MATYAIGDIQGCFKPLQRLLEVIEFNHKRDRLWLAGDLVNRGPHSLEVLRWASSLGDRVVSVMGNHDLHLLAAAEGVRKPRKRDTLDGVLEAPDQDELLAWLRARPLMHKEGRNVLVHAGVLPAWSVSEALGYAQEVEAAIRSKKLLPLLRSLYQPETPHWSRKLKGFDRLRTLAAVLTRVRVCDKSGNMVHGFADAPERAPKGLKPWYALEHRRDPKTVIWFGHWAALGHRMTKRAVALDSGCVWGGRLTAVRLEDRTVFSVPA